MSRLARDHVPRQAYAQPREAGLAIFCARCLTTQPPDLLEHGVEVMTLDVLHCVVVQTIAFADSEDRYDIRVVQTSGGAGLAPETLQLFGERYSMEGENFERDVAAERFLHCLVDHPHAASSDLAQDAVFT